MPSFQDSAVIFLLALLLFGPKKLPELARYVGKLLGEFRRASSEFRLQMEDEFRISEQAEQQKKIAAIEAAAPIAPVIYHDIPEPEHPLTPTNIEAEPEATPDPNPDPEHPDRSIPQHDIADHIPEHRIDARPEPIAIATSGDLEMMPPATGLPVARTSSSHSANGVFDSIPHTPDPATHEPEPEPSTHA